MPIVQIIDDDPTFRFVLKRSFKHIDEAIHCVDSANGKDAMDYLVSVSEPNSGFPDLILVDINMPLVNGFEFITDYEKRFSALNEQCIIYFLSSSIRESDKTKALSFSSVNGFYSKKDMMHIVSEIHKNHFLVT